MENLLKKLRKIEIENETIGDFIKKPRIIFDVFWVIPLPDPKNLDQIVIWVVGNDYRLPTSVSMIIRKLKHLSFCRKDYQFLNVLVQKLNFRDFSYKGKDQKEFFIKFIHPDFSVEYLSMWNTIRPTVFRLDPPKNNSEYECTVFRMGQTMFEQQL